MSFCAPPRAKSPLHQEVTFSYYTDLTIGKFHSPVSPDPLSARWPRSLGFLKSPPLKKILDPPMNTTYSKATDGGSNAGAGGRGAQALQTVATPPNLAALFTHCGQY